MVDRSRAEAREMMNLSNLKISSRVFYILIVLLALAGVLAVIYATRWGAALSDDSYSYVKPARDILAGKAPTFAAHYPPLLPLVVTLTGFLGFEPLLGIRLLNAVLFGVNLILASLICKRISNSVQWGLVGGVLFLVSVVVFEAHAWAMSEALYITWLLAILLTLHAYFKSRRLPLLIAAAIFSAAAALTRYAGIGIMIGIAAVIFLTSITRGFKRGLLHASIYSIIAVSLFALYPIFNPGAIQEVGSFGANQWVWLRPGEMREGFYNILLWIMPGRLARGREVLVFGILMAFAFLLIAAYAVLQRQRFQAQWLAIKKQPVLMAMMVMILASLFTLYQAHISSVYRSPLDSRLLSPTHVLFLLLLTGLLSLGWRHAGRFGRLVLAALVIWLIFLYLPRTISLADRFHEQGSGFASPYWAELDMADFFHANADREIVTTAPMGVYFATGLETTSILPMNPDQLRAHLRQKNGFLVVFNSMPLDIYGYPADDFLEGMIAVDEYSDSTIYRLAP